jgi:MFS family permease
MAISTLLIGVLPGYAQLGLMAPVLLASLRFIQGFSFAGEFSGAFTYLYESVPARTQGFAVSILGAGSLAGILLGVVVHGVLIHTLTMEQVVAWGWRIPFILGGSLGVVSYVIRRQFAEPAAFLHLVQRGETEKVPVMAMLAYYKREILVGLLLVMPVLVSVTVLVLFIPGYLTRLLDYPAQSVALANGLSMFAGVPICILMGWLSDRYDRRLLMAGASLLIALCAWPLFLWYASGEANLLLTALVGAVLWGSIEGIALLLVVSSFPTAIRYTGMASVYNLGATVFAGFGPIIAMGLISVFESESAPAFYLIWGLFFFLQKMPTAIVL